MGKKYLDTKEGSLEQSVLGVWQTAIEEGDARMDGRTKQYKEHRAKLEAARQRREEKKLNKEEVELDEKVKEYKGVAYFKDRKDAEAHMKKFAPKGRVVEYDRGYAVQTKIAGPYLNKSGKVEEQVELEEGSKEEYTKFFNAAMKKFGIDSPADLKSDEEKKKFFDYVDKNYKGEKDEEVQKLRKELFGLEEGKMSDIDQMMKDGKSAEEIAKTLKLDVKAVKKVMGESYEIGTDEYRKHTEDVTPGENGEWAKHVGEKSQSMREALAKVWGVNEGKSPFKKEEKKSLTKEVKDGKTMTGKKIASVDINPTIKEKTK